MVIGPIQIDYYSWCWQFNGCVKDEERCMILHLFRAHGATVTAEQVDKKGPCSDRVVTLLIEGPKGQAYLMMGKNIM